jgi:UDP-N-acetylmuramyl pentapeptide phosphotransferase/UDP-N-acetylglucosamine-1-phosphate transferase
MFFWFAASAIISFGLTALMRAVALRYGVVDRPDNERKIHSSPVPLLGGVGIFLTLAVVLIVAAITTGRIIGTITWTMLIGVVAVGAILIIGGVLDDIYKLPPRVQIIFPIIASLVVIFCGVGVSKLSSPFGGIIYLAAPLSGLVVFPYLMGTTYATKLSDGLDGLVTGIAAIGSLLIMALALTTKYFQPDVALIAALAAGAFIGFLPWNFHPAKIFLGEGGALLAGYILGVLSIISGAKIAVVLMALGVAVVDAAWVILRRVFWEKRSFASADRKHLHHRLLDAGFGQRTVVLFLWFISAAFGAATLLLQSAGKLVAFILLAIVTLLVGTAAILKRNAKKIS